MCLTKDELKNVFREIIIAGKFAFDEHFLGHVSAEELAWLMCEDIIDVTGTGTTSSPVCGKK